MRVLRISPKKELVGRWIWRVVFFSSDDVRAI
jgi:hypothetical protein